MIYLHGFQVKVPSWVEETLQQFVPASIEFYSHRYQSEGQYEARVINEQTFLLEINGDFNTALN